MKLLKLPKHGWIEFSDGLTTVRLYSRGLTMSYRKKLGGWWECWILKHYRDLRPHYRVSGVGRTVEAARDKAVRALVKQVSGT